MDKVLLNDPLLRKLAAEANKEDLDASYAAVYKEKLNKAIDMSKKYKRIDMCFLQMVKKTKNNMGRSLIVPSFAVLTYDKYKTSEICYFGSKGYGYTVSSVAVAPGEDLHLYNKVAVNYIFKENCNLHSLKDMKKRDLINQRVDVYNGLHEGYFIDIQEDYYQEPGRIGFADAYYHINISPDKKIPPTIDACVKEHKLDFEKIFIAWEVDEWNIPDDAMWEAPEYKGDPLVIGKKDDFYYLITQWDTTKLESYIASEFTS